MEKMSPMFSLGKCSFELSLSDLFDNIIQFCHHNNISKVWFPTLADLKRLRVKKIESRTFYKLA